MKSLFISLAAMLTFLLLVCQMSACPLSMASATYPATHSEKDIAALKTWAKQTPLQNLYTVAAINQKGFTFGTYHVEGYVTAVHECPPCPKQGVCAPCPSDFIVISDTKTDDDAGIYSKNELAIYLQDKFSYKKGVKVRCLIQIMNTKTLPQALNNAKLIYVERLRR